MFNIGIGEILFIAVLALIFIGPERLPKIMRQLGEYTYKARSLIHELTHEYQDELRPLQDLRGLADDLKPTRQLGNLLNLDQIMDVDLNKTNQQATSAPAQSSPMAQISEAQQVDEVVDGTIAPPRTETPVTQVSTPMAQIAQAMASQQQERAKPTSSENGSDDQGADVVQTDSTDPAQAPDVNQPETGADESAAES